MINDWASEIKERLTAWEVLHFYGCEINRAGFCKCPFHSSGNERTASLKVYGGYRGWHCFGCGEGGTVIDFVMKYFNLSFLDACRKLNDDFGLGLPIDKPLTDAKQKEINHKMYERRKMLDEFYLEHSRVLTAYHAALDEYVRLDKIISKNAPNANNALLTDEYYEALKKMPVAEYELECAEAKMVTFSEKMRQRMEGKACRSDEQTPKND